MRNECQHQNPNTRIAVRDGDPRALALFRRHYSYRSTRDQLTFIPSIERNRNLICGPGEKLILLTPDNRALFVWRNVNPRKIRSVNPGYCFIQAGWKTVRCD